MTGLVIPEETWLRNHFHTEPFVFPPPYDFMIAGDNLLEFSFDTLSAQEDLAGQSRRAFERGKILTQLIFPLKEPLTMLREATENYEEFDYFPAPLWNSHCHGIDFGQLSSAFPLFLHACESPERNLESREQSFGLSKNTGDCAVCSDNNINHRYDCDEPATQFYSKSRVGLQ